MKGLICLICAALSIACSHQETSQSSSNNIPDYPVVPPERQNLDVRALPPELGVSNPNCGLNEPNGIEQELVERINAFRAQPRMCGRVLYRAAPPVRWNLRLLNAAYRHSVEMARTNLVSHTSLDARELKNRILQTGYLHEQAGENIAAGQRSVAQVVNDWANSPPHCATMMSYELNEVGAACVFKKDSFYRFYWTLDMARHMSKNEQIGLREFAEAEDWKEKVVK